MKFVTLLFAILWQLAASATNDIVYSFSLYANDDTEGNCQAAGDEIGQRILDIFDDALPGFTPYSGLIQDFTNLRRQLSVRYCSRTYCSKRQNWQYCIYMGCSCSCGRGRELQVSDSASDNSKITHAQMLIDDMLAERGAALGCTLGMEMEKVRGG